ncbi:MAG TPA: hypothetical protein VNL14_06340, partial [Candidatus Acidoferrales bacterium]|nr:hypothetical protein [Candidatus Acidoferrales bacterium]
VCSSSTITVESSESTATESQKTCCGCKRCAATFSSLESVNDLLLYDSYLQRLRERLARLGARRVWRGNAWYWDLKPDFKPGDVFEI